MTETKDVSEIYELLRNPERFSEGLREAVRSGHAGALIYALEQRGITPPEGDEPRTVRLLRTLNPRLRVVALMNAAEDRGASINDPRTAVGALYQSLLGEDYKNVTARAVKVTQRNAGVDENGAYDLVEVIEKPYDAMSEREKDDVHQFILRERGITLEDYLQPGDPHTVAVKLGPEDKAYTALASLGERLYTDRYGTLLIKDRVPAARQPRRASASIERVWDEEGNSYRVAVWEDEAPLCKFYQQHRSLIEEAAA
ncbi:hypothetical protein D6789_04870, partial [Candidatus Woesearchaeota archaeon]